MFVRATGLWCKSHPAFRALTGMTLLDLRMHRTSVDGPLRDHCHHWLQSHPTLWADARFIGDYLRMHRTRILKTSARRRRRSPPLRFDGRSAVVMTRLSGCTVFHCEFPFTRVWKTNRSYPRSCFMPKKKRTVFQSRIRVEKGPFSLDVRLLMG